MTGFNLDLEKRLAAIRDQGLFRELRCIDSPQSPRQKIGGHRLLNFSSNDYLGLANDPCVKEAAITAVEQYGAGAGASRLICGSLAVHHELDEVIANFKNVEAALCFSSGYAAAVGTICSLLEKQDIIILDKLVHASIVDAARLSGAKLRVFAHNDLNDLEEILRWARKDTGNDSQSTSASGSGSRVLIVTESIFSMDGDQAPLRELVELKDRYGAWLMVDEAHATGLYGVHRRGVAELLGVSDRIEIQMGTLGKALGSSGGYICGSRSLVDFLINRARSFIFSTAPVPAAAAAATAAIHFVRSELGSQRCQLLWKRVQEVHNMLQAKCGGNSVFRLAQHTANHQVSAILPLLVGDESRAVEVASLLRAQGLYIPAIRYPTVARGEARLRLTITAAHSDDDVQQLGDVLVKVASLCR